MNSKWYKRSLFMFLSVFASGLFEVDVHFKKREYFKKYESLMQDKIQLEIDCTYSTMNIMDGEMVDIELQLLILIITLKKFMLIFYQ